jgi:hypothetical protein
MHNISILGFAVTVVLSLAYYVYTAATYLPPALDPSAPAPEVSVSGCRSCPLSTNPHTQAHTHTHTHT